MHTFKKTLVPAVLAAGIFFSVYSGINPALVRGADEEPPVDVVIIDPLEGETDPSFEPVEDPSEPSVPADPSEPMDPETLLDPAPQESEPVEEPAPVEEVLIPDYSSIDFEASVAGFVTRLYMIALNRTPEEDGLNFWVDKIKSGTMTAGEVAHDFIVSQEFRNRNLDNAQTVDILYRTFLDRPGDADGIAFWLQQLASGMTLEQICGGFTNSEEFYNICGDYGVESGMYIEGFTSTQVNKTYSFFCRLYKLCLDRRGDYAGLQFWTKKILVEKMSLGEAASDFIFSKEYIAKNTTTEQFITMLYHTMMDREPDDVGMTRWMRCGLAREYIFNSFVASQEFKNICNSFGLSEYNKSFSRKIPVPEEKPLEGKVVFVDPGHGGNDPGATSNGAREATINLAVALKTKAELEAAGATVVITRTTDTWTGLYYRNATVHKYCLEYLKQNALPDIPYFIRQYMIFALDKIMERNIDDAEGMGFMGGTGMSEELQTLFFMEQDLDNFVFISIHCNAAGSTSAHGTSIYYVTDESMKASEERMVQRDPELYKDPRCPIREPFTGRDGNTNQYFSSCLYQGVTGQVPAFASNRPTITDNFCVLREHGITSAMVEMAYLTNSSDRAMLQDPTVQDKIAKGITEGIILYFS